MLLQVVIGCDNSRKVVVEVASSMVRPLLTVVMCWCSSNVVEGDEMTCFCFLENNERNDAKSKLMKCVLTKRQLCPSCFFT